MVEADLSIEITEAMVAVGVRTLDRETNGQAYLLTSETDLVRAVYIAMEEQRSRSR